MEKQHKHFMDKQSKQMKVSQQKKHKNFMICVKLQFLFLSPQKNYLIPSKKSSSPNVSKIIIIISEPSPPKQFLFYLQLSSLPLEMILSSFNLTPPTPWYVFPFSPAEQEDSLQDLP